MRNFEITLKDGTVKELDMSIFAIDQDKQMVNLTKIADACGRDVWRWNDLESTRAYLDAYSKLHGHKPLATVRGGNNSGTWATMEGVVEFCKWISPDLYIKAKEYYEIDSEIVIHTLRDELRFGYDIIELLEDITEVIPQFAVGNHRIDFYLPEYNIAIEYDEAYHENQMKKDCVRQLYIENKIGCKFIRVKQGKEIKGVNKIIKEILSKGE